MWRKREEYSEQVQREREERRAHATLGARRSRQRRAACGSSASETGSRFAQRLGVSPDGKLRYLDWSFSAWTGEADKRKLKRTGKLVDGATRASAPRRRRAARSGRRSPPLSWRRLHR